MGNNQSDLICFEELSDHHKNFFTATISDEHEQQDIFESLNETAELPLPMLPCEITTEHINTATSTKTNSLNSQYININTNRNNLSIPLNIHNIKTLALVDTGACITTVSKTFWQQKLKENFPISNKSKFKEIKTVSGHSLDILGVITIPC